MSVAYGESGHEPLLCTSVLRRNGRIEVSTNARSALEIRGRGNGFELAGTDGVYKPADITVSGSVITVTCAGIAEPVSVRCLWTNYTDEIPVYDSEGNPLAPFRKMNNE